MSCRTYKYPVMPDPHGPALVAAPLGARFTGLQFNRFTGDLFLYAIVDSTLPSVHHQVYVVGTGWDIPVPNADLLRHVGTAITDSGFVWHAYVWSI